MAGSTQTRAVSSVVVRVHAARRCSRRQLRGLLRHHAAAGLVAGYIVRTVCNDAANL